MLIPEQCPQDILYWTMNSNSYKFGLSTSDASFYGSYDMNDHMSRMSIGRTNWEYHQHRVVNSDEADITVARSVDLDEHSEAEECIENEHEPDSPQVSWQDDIDPDIMTYEELIELGEAGGTESRLIDRVMIAEQRATLLQRIAVDEKEKLSFKECEKIAKDMNLTLEQVMHVYQHILIFY